MQRKAMDFFDDFFGKNDDFFSMNVKAPEEKETKKEKKKESTKPAKAGKENKKDCNVTLPVTILGRSFSYVVEGIGEKKASEILKEVSDPESGVLLQFRMKGMGVVYDKALSRLYVDDSAVLKEDGDTLVHLEDGKSITVCDGEYHSSFSAEDFPDKEVDEISLSDVLARFKQAMPEYEACEDMAYDAESGICYPIYSIVYGNLPDEYGELETVSVLVGGEEKEVAAGDVTAVLEAAVGKPELVAPKLTKMGSLYVSYGKKKGDLICLNEKADSAPKKKEKVETKYPLPLDLYIVTFNVHYELTPEMFGGAAKVTVSQITKKMAEQERMFADKSRKPDYLYSPDKNMLSCMFISGTKGAGEGLWKFVHTEEELKKCMASDGYCGVFSGYKDSFKFLTQPIGTFIAYFGHEYQACDIVGIDFKRKFPLMPQQILSGVIDYFKSDLSVEMVVRILYNKHTGEFITMAAKGERTKGSIRYEFAEQMEAMKVGDILTVIEIHSHNTMPAYFSEVDNADEGYVPGLYGVIGNLDKSLPTMKFRASFEGQFKEIPISEIFQL